MVAIFVILQTQGIVDVKTTFQVFSTCSYSGQGVLKEASCLVETDDVPPDAFSGIRIEGLNLEYAPDCYFTGEVRSPVWSDIPNQLLWSGTVAGKRSGEYCNFYERISYEDISGEAVKLSGTVNFIKEWEDCEVCQEPVAWSDCAYNTEWERNQQSRINYYCAGQFTDWKCTNYVEIMPCEGEIECENHNTCQLKHGGNSYCVDGLCKDLIFTGGKPVISKTKDINEGIVIIIVMLVLAFVGLGWLWWKR